MVIQIQCSLIPCRGRQAPRHATRPESAQASRDCTHGRASIAFVYTHPLAWAMPWNPMPYGESRAATTQEPPRAAPISFQDPGQGFPCPCCRRTGTGPHRRPGGRLDATPGRGWQLISALAAAPAAWISGHSCRQGAPGAARSRPDLIPGARHGFPCPCCRRTGAGPHRRPGGGSMPRLAMLAADLRRGGRAGRADLRSRTQLQPVRPAAARFARYSYKYTYTDG